MSNFRFLLLLTSLSLFWIFAPSSSQASAFNLTTCNDTMTYPGTYLLQNDIIGWSSGHCFVVGASNVTLDCQGHLVDKDGGGDFYGFFSDGESGAELQNVTVKNCSFTDWRYDI